MKAYMQDSQGFVFATSNPESFSSYKRLTPAEGKRLMKESAQNKLREILRNDPVVFAIVRSVSSSGMSRTIDFLYINGNTLDSMTGLIATALDYSQDKRMALKVSGCGMDMVFHVLSSLYDSLSLDYRKLNYKTL